MGTRDEILDAAADLLRTQGYAKATTKAIAQSAGYSEAALYKHFEDKSTILLAVISERLPELGGTLQALATSVGSSTVRANLTRLIRTGFDFFIEGFPILVSLFSSQSLLTTHRERMGELDAGPHKAEEGLVRYLRAEQRIGRVRRGADLEAAATLVFGACFQQGFTASFTGQRPTSAQLDAQAARLAKTMYEALRPAT
ncbi:TetR/AcrR family transcriptional regulator [Kribbella sp. DT2]|uniref:TetR/AcrR family transcriptional regulator n=1 Tax=Kribbella sp. DT2 TaxID=3393427 RepID=UPI003CF9091B